MSTELSYHLKMLSLRLASTWFRLVGTSFNPLDRSALADPYPLYSRLRAEDPVHWSRMLQAWVLTRYQDVESSLSDPRLSANRQKARSLVARLAIRQQQMSVPLRPGVTMLSNDPPEHTRLRRLVSKAFTPRMVQALRPRIQDIVDTLLDQAQEARRFDFARDFAHPLPVIVIAEMLGIPASDRDMFRQWSDDAVAALAGPFAPPQVMERNRRSVMAMADYFRETIRDRRKSPGADLISSLVAAEEQGQVLTEDEMLATCMLLLVAGNETTAKLLANGMLALLRHPDQLGRLREEPSLVPTAVEELLRYDSPAQMTARVATEELQIDGVRIKTGDLVIPVLGAANRDPAVFERPDQLDVSRDPNPHMAFGDGIHFCLGAPLARAEAQIALSALLQRMPNLRLVGEPRWDGSFVLRGVSSLPVECQ